MPNTIVIRSFIVAASIATFLMATPKNSLAQGNFYVGGNLGAVIAGNTRADGVFELTGTALDGQRLGPAPGETASGLFDPSFTANAVVGYDFGKRRFGRIRVEGEFFFQNANTSSYEGELNGVELNPDGQVDTSESGFIVNVLYDLFKVSNSSTYVYLGFGTANVDTSYSFDGEDRVDINGQSEMIQGGFGVSNPIRDRLSLDFKYRFRRAGLNEGGLDADIDAQILEAGLRYSF